MAELPFEPGIEYYRYVQPEVYNRLVEGYATDRFWDTLSRISDIDQAITISKQLPELAERLPELADLLEKKPFLDWLSVTSGDIGDLLTRKDTLTGIADTLAGTIIDKYFELVSDLIAVRDNLVWYSQPGVISAANDVFGIHGQISDLVTDLYAVRGQLAELNADLYEKRDDLKDLADHRDILDWYSTTDISTKLAWYTNGVHKNVLEKLVTGKMLPTIEEPAFFNKSVSIGGILDLSRPLDLAATDPLSLIQPIGDELLSLNTDLSPISGQLKGLNSSLYDVRADLEALAGNRPTLDWYSSSDVSGILSDLVAKGILPEIKDPATFLKDVDIEGKLNLLKEIATAITANLPKMRFIQRGYDFWVGPVHAKWSRSDLGSGMEGFKNWVDRIDFILDEIAAGRYSAAYALGLPFQFAAGMPFLQQIGAFMEKLVAAWG